MKLKEKYLIEKNKYLSLSKESFTFEAQSQWIDKYKRFSKLNGNITTGASDEANRVLCVVINDNVPYILGKVKALAQTKLTDFKANYQAAYQEYKDAVAAGTIPSKATQTLLAEFRDLQESLAPIKNMTSFEVTSSMEGIRTTDGVFAGLLSEVLTDNIDLLVTKFKAALVSEFKVKVSEFDQEVVEYQAAKG